MMIALSNVQGASSDFFRFLFRLVEEPFRIWKLLRIKLRI